MDDHNIINCPNDGAADRWRANAKRTAIYWLKAMPYSLADIFDDADQDVNTALSTKFTGGSIFQTFLNPYSFHRWWAPVSGKIVAVTKIPGFYYSKLIVPDIHGATIASCPYLLQVNTRGIIVIDTTGYANIGLVACIPVGMSSISSVVYADISTVGSIVTKGDELGHFKYGGSSSFAIIFEDVSKYGKALTFLADHDLGDTKSKLFPADAPEPTCDGGGIPVNVGMQIGVLSDL